MRVIEFINSEIVWGVPLLAALTLAGIYFSFKHGFIGFRPLYLLRRVLRGGSTKDKLKHSKGLSPFQTLTASLGVTLGTGNIIALGTAIAVGGAGSLLWMVISSMLGAATAYAETYRGMQYRDYTEKDVKCGAMYYINSALGKIPAKFYALLCLLASFGVGGAAQIGAAAASLQSAFGTPRVFTGIFAAVAVALIMLGGAVFFGMFTEKVIPVLSLAYLLMCIAIIVIHAKALPSAIAEIFESAFTAKAAAGGALGGAFMWGIRRGVFSNEAGIGSAVFFTSMNGEKEPHRAAERGAFAVLIDTVLLCTVTGLAMLVSGAAKSGTAGELYANYAFSKLPFGAEFLAAAVAMFALCTCAGWAVFGMRSAEYLFSTSFRQNLPHVKIYCAVFVVAVYIGAVTDAPVILGIADIFNGAMAVPNIAALFALEFSKPQAAK